MLSSLSKPRLFKRALNSQTSSLTLWMPCDNLFLIYGARAAEIMVGRNVFLIDFWTIRNTRSGISNLVRHIKYFIKITIHSSHINDA